MSDCHGGTGTEGSPTGDSSESRHRKDIIKDVIMAIQEATAARTEVDPSLCVPDQRPAAALTRQP